MINFLSKSKSGLASVTEAATVFPATSTWTCFDFMALNVAALSPNLVILAPLGAILVIYKYSKVPPVTPIVRQYKSALDDNLTDDGAKTPE